jgi:putative transposase
MTNHVHLLLTPAALHGCSNLIRDLGRRYVPYFNQRYGRTGTLWEGRYRSCVVESARYVLACHRYIETNPIRARMVGHPAEYSWSSYATNTGEAEDVLVSPHTEYLALGDSVIARRMMYQRMLDDAEDEDAVEAIRRSTNGGLPLTGDPLKAELVAAGKKVEHSPPGPRARAPKTNQGNLDLEIAP